MTEEQAEKENFIKLLCQLWQEYTECAVSNKNYDDTDFTFDNFMSYLNKRYFFPKNKI